MPPANQPSISLTSPFISNQEERKWNKLSETMQNFHDWFKQEFNTLYDLADGSFNARGMSLSLYLQTAKTMNHHLTMHHTIEERHLFPILGRSMPQFASVGEGAHIVSHKGIHKGLDALEELVEKWSQNPSSYSPTEMRACLDSFRGILFHHLDEEVADLRGENLKKHLTIEELESLPL